jgi:tryptophanyl-tRNA synthetase
MLPSRKHVRRSPITISSSYFSHSINRPAGRRSIATGVESQKTPNHVIFSGIQPTGVPHLGNYLGALQQWVKLQETSSPKTRLLYSIVDLHAITISQDPRMLKQWKREGLATLLAIGLDPDRSILFYQSSVSEELSTGGRM